MTELVKVLLDEGVGQLILNRPQQRNSLVGPLVWELAAGVTKLSEDADCKVIIIRGAEGYFCAGLDLKALMADPQPAWRETFQQDWAGFHRQVYLCDKPIIGALEGFAIAGGSALAFACDFLVVGTKSFLHVSEVERDMMAPVNILWLKLRYSLQLGLKMAVLGERHYGEDLVRLGVADRCVDDNLVVDTALAMAHRFASFDLANLMKLKGALKKHQSEDERIGYFDSLLASIIAG
ncbi:MAG: enoyl-CoA hydratase/isomerase family protein [Pseudomonadales bacterium]|nr:enoyl-CoA hydratase/isomerase family protein [Pseudomonadales bacterium]MDG1444554.1 enoyl-CoA hydratase/isomerase family protein [Pseudomonadales bacterium]